MGIVSDFLLGNALTKLTNVFEAVRAARETAFIGGGGIESLPSAYQSKIERKWPAWQAALQKHPRHVVTRELLRSMLMAQKVGRIERFNAQCELLDMLVQEGIALSLEDFERSYAS